MVKIPADYWLILCICLLTPASVVSAPFGGRNLRNFFWRRFEFRLLYRQRLYSRVAGVLCRSLDIAYHFSGIVRRSRLQNQEEDPNQFTCYSNYRLYLLQRIFQSGRVVLMYSHEFRTVSDYTDSCFIQHIPQFFPPSITETDVAFAFMLSGFIRND